MLQSQTNIQMQQIFNLIYPVGSLYFSTVLDTVAKVQAAFGGTWEKLPSGYAIWTADSGAGGTIAPGLPNITGNLKSVWSATTFDHEPTAEGAISVGGNVTDGSAGGNGWRMYLKNMLFNAKEGSVAANIYKDDVSTVQPPAYKAYVFKRLTRGLTFLAYYLYSLTKRRKDYAK